MCAVWDGRWVYQCSAAVLCTGVLGCGVPQRAVEVRVEGEALGTHWSVAIVLPHALSRAGLAGLRGRVVETLERVDRGMSGWRDDSEIVRFNRSVELAPAFFSAETRHVVSAALELARETGGAFDPTVGPLVSLWGFGPEAAAREPTRAELSQAPIGWEQLTWNARGALVRRRPGVQLDLSAIAKGYAVDAIVDELSRDQPLGLLVEVGGEVRGLGGRVNGEPWRVGIEDPISPGSGFEDVVILTSSALATSGDYRQVRELAGQRRSHVIDPRSRRPVDNGVASVSVIAPTCMEADAVATALMVLGAEQGLAWVEARPWLEALLLLRAGDRIAGRQMSSGWARHSAERAAAPP